MDSSDARLDYESNQTLNAYAAMVDSGDHKKFTLSAASLWSRRSGYSPVVRPNGVINGLAVGVAASGSNNVVDVSSGKVYLAGVETSINASADETIVRATSTDTHMINSITIDSGGSIAIVTGTDHASAFNEVRGSAGGPPWIPTGSIEIAQVRTSSFTAAVVAIGEIYSTVGTHRESYKSPLWDEFAIGDTDNDTAYVNFSAALSLIHSDDAGVNTDGKLVYNQVYTPTFSEVPIASDFQPPENSHSVNSVQVYQRTIASRASSLGQGSFTAYMSDGVTDAVVELEDQNLIFKFFPDKEDTPFIMCQGVLGKVRSFPAGAAATAACTITADQKAVNRIS